MQEYVQANFDFTAQPGSGELTIKAGDQLSVIRKGIEGGWMEGQNAKGKIGLFPESYVSAIPAPVSSSAPPPMAPPPLPANIQPLPSYSIPPVAVPPALAATKSNDPWDDPRVPIPPTYNPAGSGGSSAPMTSMPQSAQAAASAAVSYPQLNTNSSNFDDDFDDDWSDEDEEVAGQHAGSSGHNNHESRSSISEEQKLSIAEKGGGVSHSSPGTNGRHRRSQSRTTTDSRTDLSVEEEGDEDATTITDDVQSLREGKRGGGSGSGRKESVERPLSSPSKQDLKEFSATQSNAAAQRNVARSRSTGPESASMAGKQMGTAKMKTINRFSNFVKTGMESYILAANKISSSAGENHYIVIKDNQIEWKHPSEFYTCVVSKPKKESKLKGLKSFIAYSVTCSLSGIQVSRRYKHFDWLHEQLTNKYLLIPVPPLPEKQVSGRYEEDLIEHRKSILQLWVNRICRHPVLSQSQVWKHFMNCTDPGSWKKGKRTAEKDEYVGGNFFNCIEAPNQHLNTGQIEKQVDGYAKCVRSLDESTKELFERITDNQKRLIGPYKSNWQKMAAAFDSLGKSLDLDTSQLKTSAHTLHKIGNQHEEHGKKDMEQLLDYLYIYKGMFTNIPDIVGVHRSALAKIRDNDRLQTEGKLSPQDAESIHHRVDVTTYSMMAEISHFNKERDDDFRQMFGEFFTQQAAFYSSIGEQMGQLAALFKN